MASGSFRRWGCGVVAGVVAALVATPQLAAGQAQAVRGPEAVGSVRTSRLGGVDRFETAAQIALHHSGRPGTRPAGLRFVRGDRPLDAAASAGSGLPVLYVPQSGAIPASVRAAFTRIAPERVHPVGSERVLPSSRLSGMLGRYPDRWDLDTPSLSFFSSVERHFWEEQVRPVDGLDVAAAEPLTEAAIAMVNRSRNVMIVPRAGEVRVTTPRWLPIVSGDVRFVGGAASFSRTRQAEGLRDLGAHTLPRSTLAGRDRYDTSARLAREAFPQGAWRVYLVNGVGGVDVAAAASLTDGPLLSVPPCGTLPAPVRDVIADAHPTEVVAVGGPAVVCDGLVAQAARAATPLPQMRATSLASVSSRTCVSLQDGGVRCLRGGEWIVLPGSDERFTSVAAVDLEPYVTEFYGLSESGRLWVWSSVVDRASGEVFPTTPTEAPLPAGTVARWFVETGRPCLVHGSGTTSCLGATADRQRVWVRIPGLSSPRSITTNGDRVFAIDVEGRPQVWRVDEARALPVATSGLPASVVGFHGGGHSRPTTLTADGTMRVHEIGGEIDGRSMVVARGVDRLVGDECGTQGAVLRCHGIGWGVPDGFVAPAGTTVVEVQEQWIRVSDGRLFTVHRATDPGPSTVEPVRGFGG